jgi:type I restriction enzyme S subunit
MNKIDNKSAMYVTPPNNAEAKRTTIHDGDVLLTITGSLIGRVAPVPEKLAGGFISQHVAILRIDRASLDPRFLAFFLSLRDGGQSQISRMQYGQTKPGLNFEQIRSLQIPAVPLSGQLAFVARLNGTRDLLSSHRTHLDALGELFDSLQQRSFIGEL